MSRDPFPGLAGSPLTQHPYTYAENNSTNLVDPSGECVIDVAADVGFISYDIFRLTWGFFTGAGKKEQTENLAALGLDSVGAFIPCATGLGLAGRGAAKLVKVGGKLERHHLLPRQFKSQFERAGLNISDYDIELPKGQHRLNPVGLHAGPNHWNKQWAEFFRANRDPSAEEVLNQLDKMMRQSGLR